MDKNPQAKQLISRYHQGLATAEERLIVEQWFLIDLERSEVQLDCMAYDKTERRVRQNLGIHTGNTLEEEPVQKDTIQTRPRIAALMVWKLAAAVAVVTLGVWLYYSSSMNGRQSRLNVGSPGLAIQNDIAPGRNTATITFDNGEVVDLNEKELDISSATVEPLKEGSEVASETTQFLAGRIARSKTIVLRTPRGGTYQVTLPDGTKVWLNADTKVSFPSQFSGRERKVLLASGEAYFEVAHNKARPFIVKTDKQEITVLGTHFNINAYPDEASTKTTLLEGSVSVAYTPRHPELVSGSRNRKTTMNDIILKPNQQLVLTNKHITVNPIDAQASIAWKKGEFIFNDEPLESIMRKLARWYDVEVVYEGADPKALFYGSMSRYDKISKVLSKLELTGGIHFKIEGRKVIVTK